MTVPLCSGLCEPGICQVWTPLCSNNDSKNSAFNNNHKERVFDCDGEVTTKPVGRLHSEEALLCNSMVHKLVELHIRTEGVTQEDDSGLPQDDGLNWG